MHMNFNDTTRYQALIRSHQEEIAAIITREQGKTLADARGDVFRCLLPPPHISLTPETCS